MSRGRTSWKWRAAAMPLTTGGSQQTCRRHQQQHQLPSAQSLIEGIPNAAPCYRGASAHTARRLRTNVQRLIAREPWNRPLGSRGQNPHWLSTFSFGAKVHIICTERMVNITIWMCPGCVLRCNFQTSEAQTRCSDLHTDATNSIIHV